VRTLVIGIPLPNASFDNYSFASAPSLPEYQRLVIEMSSVVRVVDELIHASAEHRTFGAEPIINGPAAEGRFSLPELLDMRRREAQQFFERGGTAVIFAYPEVTLRGVDRTPQWHSYDWLPAPANFSYADHILPGFGKEAAQDSSGDHPFNTYLHEFAPALRYRAYVEEAALEAAGGKVLARSAGGVAVAFDLPVASGRLVVTPPLLDPSKDRQQVADAILTGFDAIPNTSPSTSYLTPLQEAS
jgi:hypothetical protein